MDNQAAIRWAQNLEVPPTAGTSTLNSEAGGHSEASNNEEQRQLQEKKRKGKQVMEPAKKKRKLVIQDESSKEDEAIRAERRTKQRNDRPCQVYEKMVIHINSEILKRMLKFGDANKEKECASRISSEKPARAGKMLHQPSLQDLEVEERFLEYITGVGFDWLLEHHMPEVPIALAQEFFTTFKFKPTTDLEEESISFWIFNREMKMRMGGLSGWDFKLQSKPR